MLDHSHRNALGEPRNFEFDSFHRVLSAKIAVVLAAFSERSGATEQALLRCGLENRKFPFLGIWVQSLSCGVELLCLRSNLKHLNRLPLRLLNQKIVVSGA